MSKIRPVFILVALFFFLGIATCAAVLEETYFEDFDDRQDGATIDGVDFWEVDEGEAGNAVTQDTTTLTGTGNALEIAGDETPVKISRSKSIGELSPCWVEFYVRAGIGGETPDVPQGKAMAVTFDYTGKVFAADGSSWVDTGKTFTQGKWYRVLSRLDFSTHLYDIYIMPADIPQGEFIPAKENLQFIDTSINSVNELGLEGVYSEAGQEDNTYIDDILVNFIKRLEIITSPQVLMKGDASQPIVVQLQDSLSGPQAAWEDIALQLSSESETGEFSLEKEDWQAIEQIIIPEGRFQGEFYYKDGKEGKPIISVKEYPDRGWEQALQIVKVVGEQPHFDISSASPQIAGEQFPVVITALDGDGETDEDYNSEIEISARYVTPATGTMEITPQAASGFEYGILELEALYPDCGIVEIEVTDVDEPERTGLSGEILFVPASFKVECGEIQIVNKVFPLEVSAYNALGQITPNYVGPCELTTVPISPEATDGELSPDVLEGEDFSQGVADKEISYNRWGAIKVEAHHLSLPAPSGLSSAAEFQPKSIRIEVALPPGERTFFYTGEEIEITVSLLDEEDAPIVNYSGNINIDATLGLDMPPVYQFIESDEGLHVFTAVCDSPGTYFVSAEEGSAEISAQSGPIEVKQAIIEVISTESPVGTTEVTIILTDEEGEIITAESDLNFFVELGEEFPNESALSSAILHPVVFHNGVSRIVITDSEAETVTVSPRSSYKFKIKKGTVKFGRAAKKGIGTLMWRELKE